MPGLAVSVTVRFTTAALARLLPTSFTSVSDRAPSVATTVLMVWIRSKIPSPSSSSEFVMANPSRLVTEVMAEARLPSAS